jgi:hypothetical protein
LFCVLKEFLDHVVFILGALFSFDLTLFNMEFLELDYLFLKNIIKDINLNILDIFNEKIDFFNLKIQR